MQGFKALDVKYRENSLASHILFVKPHSVREKVPEKPPDRTLFVVGVPPYCSEECIKELFSTFGTVENVYLHKSPSSQPPPVEDSKYFPNIKPVKGFKIAYVVFQKESQAKKVLDCEETLVLPKELIVTGIQKWNLEYNNRFPNQKEMEKQIKVFMDKFDHEANLKAQMEKDLSEPQNDGWVTVTKRGRTPGFARKESVARQLRRRGERQRKKKELNNFYTFQIKESKMKNLVALRKKFEDDKRKIAALKEVRRFKPF